MSEIRQIDLNDVNLAVTKLVNPNACMTTTAGDGKPYVKIIFPTLNEAHQFVDGIRAIRAWNEDIVFVARESPAGEAGNLIEPVAWRSAYTEEPGAGVFIAATVSSMVMEDWQRFGRIVDPLVPASALAAYQAKVGELDKLIEYFRGEGYGQFGWNGDVNGWSPAETAINAMRSIRAQPSQWLDISKAPRDGTSILVLCPGARIYPEIQIDWWSDKYTQPCWARSSPKEQPKYWQPLPSTKVKS